MIGAAHLMMRGASGPVQPKGLFAWGVNDHYQLMQSDFNAKYSSPIQMGSSLDWSTTAGALAGTERSFLAIKSDDTLWSWGWNQNGQLGLGDRTSRSSAVQVGADTDWAQLGTGLYFSFAIKTGGTLWAWGYNFDGQLGLGDITHRSSPAQVGSGTNWTRLAPGCEIEKAAIRT
jgi:alpha-tubulin suppressor-like RCC1 family protein